MLHQTSWNTQYQKFGLVSTQVARVRVRGGHVNRIPVPYIPTGSYIPARFHLSLHDSSQSLLVLT